ncbi:class I SAM-dependent methyltransferase [Undibacterium sp. CY18W]|uniref:Class I SAM-dependent methyltransferase n=1 Tax=Undibacterium hunanense TaxID=2762292 RepID=A0ABR6ZT04_9BURK|nr:class I SAM-dependent methyltransferase [Undibacterium hunanense]MBC3919033.1 class I SAM-dependent methyltransferase [Undibacterium hunanense]
MKSSKNYALAQLHFYLSKWPFGFMLVKTVFSGTFIHRGIQSAVHQYRTKQCQAPIVAHVDVVANENTVHWDNHVKLVESKVLKGWLDWEFIEVEHIRPSVSGDRSIYYLQHFFTEHLPHMPVKRALSLGCGGGNLERALIGLNASETIDAFDASPESINLAKRLAVENGCSNRIHYNVADIDKIKLEANSYDFIVAKMSLHHFEDFDHIFAQISRALKPGGVFMFNEYIGPTRFQWTELQLSITNRILQTLPEKYRLSAFTGSILDEIQRPTIKEMIDMDPSEAINSSEIIPKVEQYFDVVELKRYGGTILHLLMNHIMANFDTDKELDATLLRLIFLQEQLLVENKVLDSDFCYAVVKPKKN